MLLIVTPLVASAQQVDVRALFQKVASVYGATSGYVIRAQSSNTGRALSGGAGDPAFTRPPDPTAQNTVTLARSGKSMRYEAKSGVSGQTLIWITDSVTEWKYRPQQRQYTESTAMPWPAQAGPGPGLPGIDWTYFSKFRALPGVAQSATLVKTDTTCNGPTALVEIRIPETTEPVTERLWIQMDTGLVCRSEIHRVSSGRGGVSSWDRITTWTYEQVGGTVDPGLLSFQPPKSAKLVKRLPEIVP